MQSFKIETDDYLQVQAYSWPVEKPVAILQIVHGMMEHARRYDHFANWLNKHQVAVYANDHIGHGLTAENPAALGHFPRKDDWQRSVDILRILNKRIQAEHPGIPVFLLGQSMGSVLVQTFMIRYGKEASGLILTGAIRQSPLMANVGLILSGALSVLFGPADRSKLLIFLGYGQYNRKFQPNRTKFDWLSSENSVVDEYVNSPLCGFPCSNRFYQNLSHGFKYIAKRGNLKNIPAGMPVYILAGEDDPAGNFGNSPQKIKSLLNKFAHSKVELKLYPSDRHEVLNELNREEVYSDVLEWIRKTLKIED
jgi:alpha-beta hydrolase superfamily lysophospholipase